MTETTPNALDAKSFAKIFRDTVKAEVQRTGFTLERLTTYLPPNLKAAFNQHYKPQGNIAPNEEMQAVLKIVEDTYANFPAKKDKAKSKHAAGFDVCGTPVALYMDENTARQQITNAISGLQTNAVITTVHESCKDQFTKTDVTQVVLGGSVGKLDRVLVAKTLLKIQEMKTEQVPQLG